MCSMGSVCFRNVMHGHCKGTINDIKGFQRRIIAAMTELNAIDEGGSIKRINSSEIINDKHIIDMDIWILLNKPIQISGEFNYIEEFALNNVLIVDHIGSPKESSKTIDKMNAYMREHSLVATSSAYNHSLHVADDNLSEDNMHFKIYLNVKKR